MSFHCSNPKWNYRRSTPHKLARDSSYPQQLYNSLQLYILDFLDCGPYPEASQFQSFSLFGWFQNAIQLRRYHYLTVTMCCVLLPQFLPQQPSWPISVLPVDTQHLCGAQPGLAFALVWTLRVNSLIAVLAFPYSVTSLWGKNLFP